MIGELINRSLVEDYQQKAEQKAKLLESIH
jgi:hypothetical protein